MDQALGTMIDLDSQAVWPSKRPIPGLQQLPPRPMIDGGQMHQAPLPLPRRFFFLLGFAKATCKLI